MAKRSAPEIKIDGNRWLTTYADLMNNLLVMFIMLYAISVIDLSKYEQLVISFSNTFGKTTKTEDVTGTGDFSIEDLTKDQIAALAASASPLPESQKKGAASTSTPDANETLLPGETDSPAPEATPGPTPATQETAGIDEEDEGEDEYDELVSRISKMLKANGYDQHITVEKNNDFIYLRFREGILFYPDVAAMRGGAAQVLSNVAAVIMDSYDLISNIDISGHTARISNDLPSKENLFSWELSTNRALTVLEFLVKKCDMPQDKLSVTGNSCNILMVEGDSEEQRAQNRRVEIRLTRAVSK
jgi:chemotaxis protein MotB